MGSTPLITKSRKIKGVFQRINYKETACERYSQAVFILNGIVQRFH